MTPRRRLKKNKELPDNVYPYHKNDRTYYRYKHPITGKMHSLGSNKQQAVSAARILNTRLIKETSLVDQVLNNERQSMTKLIERYETDIIPTKQLEASTLKHYERRLKRFKSDIGGLTVSEFSTASVAEYLDSNFKRDSYIKHRGLLSELFRFAQTKGLRTDNPVEPTLSKSESKKERSRLKLNEYIAIHQAAPDWMKIAMEIALITLQGRFEVCNMKFSDIKENHIYIVREKTKKNEWAHIRIQMNTTLDDIIKRARQSGIVSPYIVHREPERRNKAKDRNHWTQLTLNDFSKRFRELRDSTGLFDKIPTNQRPTFHEIRALGAWLYEKQGFNRGEYVQKLMAHADEKMTEYYQSGHERKWMDVEAGLDFKAVLKQKTIQNRSTV